MFLPAPKALTAVGRGRVSCAQADPPPEAGPALLWPFPGWPGPLSREPTWCLVFNLEL